MARRVTVLAVLAALCLAGCGGDEEADVEASIDAYVAALADRDAAGVCGLVDPETVADFGSTESCERVYAGGFELIADRDVQLPEYEIANVSIDGETATVALDVGGREHEVELIDVDGAWKLHGASATSQFHPDLVPGEFP